MAKTYTIRTDAEYRAAIARVEQLSGIPLGADDPRAEELDAWLRALEVFERRRSDGGHGPAEPSVDGQGR